jgi:hypothetical protein
MLLNIYIYFIYSTLFNVFEGMNLRGAPDLLRDHPCGDLPIPRIQPKRFGNGGGLWVGSGKLLLAPWGPLPYFSVPRF